MFSAKHFHDDDAARRVLEDTRWANGRVCPHCGTFDRSYATKRTQKSGAVVYRCGEPACRKDFSVTTKSVMESSHIPLHKWMQGFYLMASSKKGVSAHQLHRTLKITYKAAWFMAHRIREAMRADGTSGPLGGEGQVVEADETYYGYRDDKSLGKRTIRGKRGHGGQRPIIAFVERGGSVRTFYAAVADKASVTKIVADNVARESYLYTDESRRYGEAHDSRIRSLRRRSRHSHQHCRECVFSLQAWNAWRLPALPGKSICTDILPNLTSATITVQRWA